WFFWRRGGGNRLVQLAEDRGGEVDGPPLERPRPHVPAIDVHGQGAEQELPAAPFPKVFGVERHLKRRLDAVDEDDQAGVAGAEALRPALQAIDVLAGSPVLPDLARLVRLAAGITPALDVHQQPGFLAAVDDKIE